MNNRWRQKYWFCRKLNRKIQNDLGNKHRCTSKTIRKRIHYISLGEFFFGE